MDKTFKRTLLGAAVAMAAVSGSANAAIALAGDAVQLYGQAAGFAHITNPEVGDGVAEVVMESRIGFRGTVEFDNFAPNLVWQIESGNADNSPDNDKTGADGQGGGGALGVRDTFIGFDFDGVGSFKFGRQLVAAYNYVDWPHSNPGLGNVFDWHNTIDAGYESRADSTFRFDSANFGGFNFQATLSGMEKTRDAAVISVAGSYTTGGLNLHAGYYTQGEYDLTENKVTSKKGDISYMIVGGSLSMGDITLTASWKGMENGLTNNDQDAFSATAQYVMDGTWLLKAGYAATTDSTKGDNDGSTAVTARVGYLLPSAIIYSDIRSYDYKGDDKSADGTNVLVGIEYYW